jgi:hypothetical protein
VVGLEFAEAQAAWVVAAQLTLEAAGLAHQVTLAHKAHQVAQEL